MLDRLRLILSVAACLGGSTVALAAPATYPERVVAMVVPYPAGGATDTMARILAKGLSRQLGQEVFVENKGGAGTVIGAAFTAQSTPDGYTLLLTSNSTFTLNPAIRHRLPYDPLKSFESIGAVGSSPLVLLAHPSLPVKTLGDLVSLAKAQPGKLSYASFGIGTTPHFAGEMFKVMAGLDMTHVPYKGEAPALQDLIGGQVPLSFDTNVAAIPQIRAGKVRALAVTSAKASASLPGVPSIAESGYPDYEMVPWYALVAPRGLPEPVRKTLRKALIGALSDPTVRGALIEIGLDIADQPGGVEERISRELPVMRAYVHKANIPIE